MKHCKYFFFVYAIVILSSVGANAATDSTKSVTGLATPNYVDGAMTRALSDAKTYADTAANNAKSAAITSANENTTTEIGRLAAVARSGSYNDLSNRPTIPAAQVNSDWNATTGKAQILNKPTLGKLAAKDTIAESDITGTINQGKINGLSDALNAKQTTGNMVNPNADGNIPTADAGSTTKYPSIKAAEQIAANAGAAAASKVAANVAAVEVRVDALENATVTTTTGNGMVKTVSKDEDDNIVATRGLVVTNDIDNHAVTAVKTNGVIGKIPSGSATATTYADIWVQ